MQRIIAEMKPPPPKSLSAEEHGVWTGWHLKKDREVIREAAVKGLHIELALTFLGAKSQRNLAETKKWFMDEVHLWINELLMRQQIFRAKHVLTNCKLDAEEHFKKLFLETKDKDMRNYIGNHLLKMNSLDDIVLKSWNLLKHIEQPNSIVLSSQIDKNCKYSVMTVHLQTDEWKTNIATELFFQNYDFSLTTFLNPDWTWKYLIQNQMLDFLKLWINIYFLQNTEYIDKKLLAGFKLDVDTMNSLKKCFLEWSITYSMIEYQSDCKEFNNIILNELGSYGIYTKREKTNLITILTRISHKQNIPRLFDIFNLSCATVKEQDFYKILVEYCLENKLYSILSACTAKFNFPDDFLNNLNSRHLTLWKKIKESFDQLKNKDVLRKNIFQVAQFFVQECMDDYFVNNPLILLALLVFTKDLNLFEIFSCPSDLTLADSIKIESHTLKKVLEKLPLLKKCIDKDSAAFNDLDVYELLKKHSDLNVTKAYNFRFEKLPMPHCSEDKLVKRFGYVENLDYTFYLNRSRPSSANLEFSRIQLVKYGVIDDIDKYEAKTNAHELALKNFWNMDVISSCVAFIEMIGEDSELLRNHASVANILFQNCEDNTEVKELFANVDDNARKLLKNLETVTVHVYEDLSKTSSADEIVTVLKYYAVVVNFAKFHNLPLPESLLKHCTENDIWLTFLVFVQYFNYPVAQIQSLLNGFRNKSLIEHLQHAVMNDIKLEDQRILLKDRDSRNYLLSKIGLQKSKDDIMLSSGVSGSSLSSTNSTVSSDMFDTENIGFNANLLQVLIRCHNSVDPPKALLQACQVYKNSLLPVLATCYEPDSVATSWVIWLSITSGIDINSSIVENNITSSDFVTQILVDVLKAKQPRALVKSFQIFLWENPLKDLAKFFYECVHYLNLKTATKYLEKFKTRLQATKYNTAIPEVDYEMTYLMNKYWLEKTSVQLICTALGFCFNSRFHQIQFLKILCSANLSDCFTNEIPDFYQVLELLNCLPKTDTNLTLSIIFDPDKRRSEILRCVKFLTNEKKFESALKLALLENVGKDHVLLEQWTDIFNNDKNENFCKLSHEVFTKYKVAPESVVEFYEKCCDHVDKDLEKYDILKTAFHCIQNYKLTRFGHLEKSMWMLYFSFDEMELYTDEYDNNNCLMLSELQQHLKIDNIQREILDGDKVICLENTVSKLLNCGNILQALRLQMIFQHNDINLEILKTCLGLAEGTLLPYQLNTDQRLLLSSPNLISLKPMGYRRRTFLSPKVSSMRNSASNTSLTSTLSMTDSIIEVPMEDILAILETLTRRLKSGSQIGQKILMYYRIAVNTDHSYKTVVKCKDPMLMVKSVMKDNCKNKLEVLHDCFAVYEWDKKKIADFLCEEIINALNNSVKTNANSATLWDLNLDTDFHLILLLLSEQCTILGLKLFTYANALYKLHTRTQVNECDMCQFAFITELFIRAHDCFTADCNMEGISSILRKSQKLVMVLLNLKCWQLMVRLLTGVGRYTEMNYVFEILKEHDQFEHLLRKGHRNDNNLKVALLEFLKNRCPENRELYRNVALYFTLFSEVAELWEIEAQSIIRKLISISKLEMQNNGVNPETQPFVLLTNTDGTKICLNRAMINYTHATEYHLQGERLASAMKSAKQAELIALQMSLLKDLNANATVNCLLNLNEDQLSQIVTTELNFQQTLLLAKANNFQVDWATVIYEQYVIQGQSQYLDDFLTTFSLNDSLAHDITRKFLSTNQHTPANIKAIKNILIKVPSVHTKYKLASELAFGDIVESLLAGSQLAYLRDTVWKKGYKQK